MIHQEGSNTPPQELDNDFDNISYAESMFDPQKGTQASKLLLSFKHAKQLHV
jgi:hypothetical protein